MSGPAGERIVVCDASPLIFLAKIDQLTLLRHIPGGECVVLNGVVREILSDQADPLEKHRLEAWLSEARRVDYSGRLFRSEALSASDQSSLAWAVQNRADWLVADERLLRRFARERGIAVIGFCGILVKAAAVGLLQPSEAQARIDEAIARHGLRLSIPVYQAIRQALVR